MRVHKAIVNHLFLKKKMHIKNLFYCLDMQISCCARGEAQKMMALICRTRKKGNYADYIYLGICMMARMLFTRRIRKIISELNVW